MSPGLVVAMLGLGLALRFLLAAEDHIAEAITDTKQAIDHGKMGHPNILATMPSWRSPMRRPLRRRRPTLTPKKRSNISNKQLGGPCRRCNYRRRSRTDTLGTGPVDYRRRSQTTLGAVSNAFRHQASQRDRGRGRDGADADSLAGVGRRNFVQSWVVVSFELLLQCAT